MKKLSFLLRSAFLMLLFSSAVRAEEFDVQLTPSLYAGGYNISCYGANTGSINLFITGGVAPYTYVWADGPIIRNRTNLVAGNYQVTVTTSNGQSVIREINLTQPDLFQVTLSPLEYEGGYNINENGGNNGEIGTEIRGGVPPYNYLWSNGGIESKIDHLNAGNYSISVHDATNCVANASTILIEPTVLHVVSIIGSVHSSGYNIACNKTCTLSLTVAGGTPFGENGNTYYHYEWSNGTTGADTKVNEAGRYTVTATDNNGASVNASILVTQAPTFSAEITPFVYSNSKNTSCYNCNNGSISTIIHSGTAPYTYTWNNGSHAQNPNGLGAGSYTVVMKDAAGCLIEKTTLITSPEREDWTMGGNYNTDENSHFIGTRDNHDFVFKANDSERIRLLKNGGTQFNGNVFANNFKLGNESSSSSLAETALIGNTRVVSFGGAPAFYRPGSTLEPIHQWVAQSKGPYDVICATPNPNTDDLFVRVQSDCYQGNIDNWHYVNGIATANRPLLLNYYSGNDVGLCANFNAPNAGGTVSTGWTFEVGHPLRDLDVAGNIRGDGNRNGLKVVTLDSPDYNTQLSVHGITSKIIAGNLFNTGGWYQDVFSIKGNGETFFGEVNSLTPAFYIKPYIDASFNYQPSNVGIGTKNPMSRLHVVGDVRISNLGNQPEAYNLVQADINGELSPVSTIGLASLIPSINFWKSNNNGTDVYHLNGKVGIGTNEPNAQLQVGDGVKSISLGGFWNNSAPEWTTSYVGFNAARDEGVQGNQKWTMNGAAGVANGAAVIASDLSGQLRFITIPQDASTPEMVVHKTDGAILSNERMIIRNDGKVGIGNPVSYPAGYSLYVGTGIITEKLKIALGTSTEWMDKVFDSDYKLRSLNELETFISTNKHLPEIPTTKEVQKDGIDVGTFEAKLLQKVEELTLYVIKINKENNSLKERVQFLEKAK
ncbi:MAG: SprB repeat-containing protein [Bacteroidetes bacterium]|nr:SprB repeat-containing protein [Bacteroidota bacterium]